MERHGFVVLNKKRHFLVINPKKEFKNGHTHIKSKSQAFYLCDCAYKKKIPKNTNNYFLTSLIRISTDNNYIRKLEELIEVRNSKGHKEKYIVCRY